MLRLLVDEDLPRSLAPTLRAAGYDAADIRDEGLRGQPDARIFQFAQERGFAVLTGDVEFGNELVYPPAGHRGVVLTRFPNDLPATILVKQIVASLAVVADENLDGAIVVVEPGRVRVRRSAKG
jgi:predicted nuclease of predicted toxin-antitoxin system